MAVALIGAAVGAGIATTAIAVSDYQSGNARGAGEAAFGIAGGTLLGAMAGAAITGIPYIPAGLQAIESAIADFASKSFTLISPSPGIVTTWGQTIAGFPGITIAGLIFVCGKVGYDLISITELVGEKIYNIGRAAAMCWIHFGYPVEIEIQGRKRFPGKFALDLDCPWRIRNSNGKLVLGSADMFAPSSEHEQDEDFDWDIQGNNLFDEKAKYLFSKEISIVVTSAELNASNDLTITFSNGLILECFVNLSSQEECWRLFKTEARGGDFIVTGMGIESC